MAIAMTDEVAATKWCPFSHETPVLIVPREQPDQQPVDGRVAPPTIWYCIGSRCAAWQGLQGQAKGFCGLAAPAEGVIG